MQQSSYPASRSRKAIGGKPVGKVLGTLSVSTLAATLLLIQGWSSKVAATEPTAESATVAQLSTPKPGELTAQTPASSEQTADEQTESEPTAEDTTPPQVDTPADSQSDEGEDEDKLEYGELLKKIDNGEVREVELDQINGIARVQLWGDA
ncbi:MAG: hypothetical protein AAFU53_00160, partial [Cyanobacteria bacterium J06632_3]